MDPVAEAEKIAFDRAGSGQRVLLISGFPQTRLSWNKLVPLLAPRFETIAADLPSFGDSGLLTDCFQQAIEERAGVIAKRHRNFPGENVIGPETRRNSRHFFQAQAEQRRTREQNESERDLPDNKSMPKALSGATNCAGA